MSHRFISAICEEYVHHSKPHGISWATARYIIPNFQFNGCNPLSWVAAQHVIPNSRSTEETLSNKYICGFTKIILKDVKWLHLDIPPYSTCVQTMTAPGFPVDMTPRGHYTLHPSIEAWFRGTVFHPNVSDWPEPCWRRAHPFKNSDRTITICACTSTFVNPQRNN